MRDRKRDRIGFPLRLPRSLKERAMVLAQQDGVSLNHFISVAVAEKASRLETLTLKTASQNSHQPADRVTTDKP
jgi:hypothetical protein